MVAGMENDYRSMDGLLLVQYRLPDRSTVLDVDRVQRGFTTTSQIGESGGVVQKGDSIFKISRLELPDGVKPEVKGAINPSLAGDSGWYTILQVMYAHQTELFHCVARELTISLGLRQLGTLQKRALTQASDGSPTWVWSDEETDVPCRVQSASATTKQEYGVEDLKVTHLIHTVETLDVSEKHRLVVDGKYYYVKSWKDADALGKPFVIIAEEGKGSGFPMVRPESDSSGEEYGGVSSVRGRRAHGKSSEGDGGAAKPRRGQPLSPRRASQKGKRRASGRDRDAGRGD